jgi:hypothetical protein
LELSSQENEMGMACSRHGENMNAYRVLVGNPEGNSPLGRPRSWFEDNIKCILEKYNGVTWNGSGKRPVWALVNTVMNLRVP